MEKVERVQFATRLTKENHEFIKLEAIRQERSANWILDKLVTQAREVEQEKKNASQAATSEASDR